MSPITLKRDVLSVYEGSAPSQTEIIARNLYLPYYFARDVLCHCVAFFEEHKRR
jgi:hypothetical protein